MQSAHEINLLIAGLGKLALAVFAAVLGGIVLNRVLRRHNLRWTWAFAGLPVALTVFDLDPFWGFGLTGACLLGASIGARWHRDDLAVGVDFAERAEGRLSIRNVIDRTIHRRATKRDGWVFGNRLIVGEDAKRLPVSIPIGYRSGEHTLVVGATGSGKTVSETWIAARLIDEGHGAIVIDPKGDDLLRDALRASAQRCDRQLLEWTPGGPCSYNPYEHGDASEIADKALAGETFTEPHYLRQAQRYLGHAVRTLQLIGHTVTPRALAEVLRPELLDTLARELPEEDAATVHEYLDSLDEKQKRDLKGVRDRLSILAESDIGRLLEPAVGRQAIDLHAAVSRRSLVYFRLDADRRALVAQMLAASIVSDLVTLVAVLQRQPVPTVVVIDEFAAVAAEHVSRLFGRARSAGLSLVLGAQELADLKTTGEGLREKVLGNVATVIAHRQNVPESAELIAGMASTRPAWVTTEQTSTGLLGAGPSGRGTRRRGYEYALHPSRIKTLGTGQAAVIVPGPGPRARIARMFHLKDATR